MDDPLVAYGTDAFGVPSRVLLGFDFSTRTALLLSRTITSASLHLTLVPCVLSSCSNQAGTLQVFPLLKDFTEGQGVMGSGANWCDTGVTAAGGGAVPWQVAGADGGEDHGLVIGQADAVGGGVDVALGTAFLQPVLNGNGTVQLLLTTNGSLAVSSASSTAPATLSVTFCE